MKLIKQINELPWHPVRRWPVRKLTQINRIIIHQELGEGSVAAVNRYHIGPNHISSKGCPHFCYHYGIEKSGEIIQANELNNIVWHTTGQNVVGIGIMLVGDFSGPGHEGKSEPTEEQMVALGELCEYLFKAFGIGWGGVFGHYHFGKEGCPGRRVGDWIEGRRGKG